jgi:hypothetical protein
MTTVNYFTTCKTSEEIKTEYKRLCRLHHPDVSGYESTAVMQEINRQYAFASDQMKRREKPNWTEDKYESAAAVDEAVRQAIEKIISLHGITIEVCGLWVWVHGQTKAVKDSLKAAGYRWAPKKDGQPWYFAGIPAGGGRPVSMDQIRYRYGSQVIKSADDKTQAVFA